MKSYKFSILLLTVATLLASCSKDESLMKENGVNGGMTTAKISVTVPSGGMSARATASNDATATRCLLQVLDKDGNLLGDKYSDVRSTSVAGTTAIFTVMLKADEQYDFLVWADNAATEVTDLKNVPYENGTTIAFSQHVDNAVWSANGISCTLNHAVSRITVHSATAVTLTEENNFTLEVPMVYTAYNVATGAVTGESSRYTYTNSTATATANSDLARFYVLVDGDNQALTMQYNGKLENPAVTIGDVPLKPNCHTTLTGDVYNLGLTNTTVTATISDNWTDGEKIFSDYIIDSDGTYIVYTAKGLLAWAETTRITPSLNCTLAADITMPTVSEGETNWTLVGGDNNQYVGTFDGKNHTIAGLIINHNEYYIGMFSYIGRNGTVKNLILKDVNIKGEGMVGGVAGCSDGTVENCSVSGSVSGDGIVGGIAGVSRGSISACHSTGTIHENGSSAAGGILGFNNHGTVNACYSMSDVSGTDLIGGVAGYNYNSTITASYSTGNISGNSKVGGVVGRNLGSIFVCYSTGNVSGNSEVGGIVGENYGAVTICYWSNYEGAGIGNETGETTKVDGTDVTWINAQEGMNAALGNYEWQYVGASATTPPTLSKK